MLTKSIASGAEHRKESHELCSDRSCPYCLGNRHHKNAKRFLAHTETASEYGFTVSKKIAKRALW